MEVNAYEILGIEETASDFDIKRAFRREVRRCHPDVGGVCEDFIQLQRAYTILMDEKLRGLLGKQLLFKFHRKKRDEVYNGYDRRGRSKSIRILDT